MQKLWLGIVVLALASTIAYGAQWNPEGSDGPHDINLTCEIPCWISIEWQDSTIQFSDQVSGITADYFRAESGGVVGQYDAIPAGGKASTDPWAKGYYESKDGAWLWLWTNNDLSMTVNAHNDLENQEQAGVTLPSWYTIAGSGFDNGFLLNGGYVADGGGGNIPGDGKGGYAGTAAVPAGYDMALGGQAFHPIQEVFNMTPGNIRKMQLLAPAGGNLKWLCRIKRNEVNDPGGLYKGTITVSFTSP